MLLSVDPRKCAAVIVLLLLGGLYFLPLLSNNYLYIDDFGRVIIGNYLWTVVGRPLADVVMIALNFGLPLTDLAPLPQIAALSMMLYCCYLLFLLLDTPRVPAAATAMASSLFLFQPFFLQNISYHFDSFPMALSILCATVAGTFRHRNHWLALAVPVVLLLASFCLYQAAFNVYISICIIRLIKSCRDEADFRLVREGLKLLAIAICAGGLYSALIHIPQIGGNASARAGMVPANIEGVALVLRHITEATWTAIYAFNPTQRSILAFYSVITILSFAWMSWSIASGGGFKVDSLVMASFVLLSFPMLLLLSYGFLSMLSETLYSPRLFVALGLFMTSIAFVPMYSCASAVERLKSSVARTAGRRMLGLVAFVPLLICVTHSYAFANAMRAQMFFTETIISQVREHLQDSDLQKPFTVSGVIPFAPEAAIQIRKYPLLGRLVPKYLGDTEFWGRWVFGHYTGVMLKTSDAATRTAALAKAKSETPVFQTPVFRLYVDDTFIVLAF